MPIALNPTELTAQGVGQGGIEPPTSVLSGLRSSTELLAPYYTLTYVKASEGQAKPTESNVTHQTRTCQNAKA